MCTGTLLCNPSHKTGLPKRKACRAAFRNGNFKETATLVEIFGNVFSDAVSITAISTTSEWVLLIPIFILRIQKYFMNKV